MISRSQADLLIRLIDGRTRYLVNEIRITESWLAARCGSLQSRTAWGWINSLIEHKLIDVIDRNRGAGTYDLRIHDPTPERADEPDPSPQRPLPFPVEQDLQSTGDGGTISRSQEPRRLSRETCAPGPAAQISARKPPPANAANADGGCLSFHDASRSPPDSQSGAFAAQVSRAQICAFPQ